MLESATGAAVCLRQCVKAREAGTQRLSGRARVHTGFGEVAIKITADWSDLGGCAGALGSSETLMTLPDSGGEWTGIPGRLLRAPVGAVSASVAFEVSAPSGSPFTVHLDELSSLADVLWIDGFEGGDTGGWSVVVP